MKQWCTSIAIVSFVIAFLVACSGAPIYNVTNAAIVTPEGKEPTLDQITKEIIAAGEAGKWTMVVQNPGYIVGTLNIRSHQAQVNVTYDTKTYNIAYRGSLNLKYDPNSKTIHENYNVWIQKLDSAIRARVATAGQ